MMIERLVSPVGRLLVVLVAGVGSLIADGGTGLFAPAGPVTARPPLPRGGDLFRELTDISAGGGPRRLEALARVLAADPDDEEAAIRLARVAARSGRLDWAEAFLAGAGRRATTAALALARAEAHYARGEIAAGLVDARRALQLRPDSSEATLAAAAGRAASGDVLGAVGLLDRRRSVRTRDAAALASRQRAAQLLALVQGTGEGPRRAWQTWQEWRRRGDVLGQARALLLIATLERLEGGEGPARRAASRALRMSLAAGDPMTTAMALSQSADLATAPGSRRSWQSAACRVLREVGRQARLDCLLSALEGAWRDGSVARAVALHDRIAPAVSGNAILELRLAHPGIVVLRATGRLRDAERLAARAARAAAGLGQPAVQAHHLIRVAILGRSQGRIADAEAALERAARVAPAANHDLWVLRQIESFELSWSRGAIERARRRLESSMRDLAGASPELRLLVDLQALRLDLLDEPVGGSGPDLGRQSARAPAPGPEGVAILARRALQSEIDGDALVAIQTYLEALRHLHDWTGSMDPLLAALVSDTWRVLGRRAVDLALRTGRVPEALEALELGRWQSTRHLATTSAEREPAGAPRDGRRSLPAPSLDAGWRSQIASVPAASALLVYAIGPRRAWGIVVRERGAFPFRIAPGVNVLRGRVELWRDAVLARQPGAVEATGTWLAEALLEPADRAGLLDGVEAVHVIPDDVLHGLSFAALPGSSGAVYGDRFVWSRSPSLEAWDGVQRRRERPGATVAFGPTGGVATRAELAAAASGPADAAHLARRATETRWRRAARSAGVLHFAGHATAPDPGLRGGMLTLRADGINDGRLTLPEILTLELDGTAVVLLGCDTVARPDAPAALGPAPELPSLSEAFLAAGTRAVVGSLWAVSEDVTREVAEVFYEAGGPLAGARAVAEARRRLRERWPERPDRWAAVVWIGPS